MLLTVLSGLLGIAAHLPFSEAPWVWLKALLGVVVFEATLQLQSYARGTAQVAGELAAGEGDPALLEVLKRSLGLALWVLLLVSLAQVVLGVWRPRIRLPGSAPVAPPAP
jgi:hypothetical protein